MSVGVIEIAVLVLVTIATVLAMRTGKRRWLAVIPLFFLIATLVSPSDIASTALIAVPNCVLFVVALRYCTADGDYSRS